LTDSKKPDWGDPIRQYLLLTYVQQFTYGVFTFHNSKCPEANAAAVQTVANRSLESMSYTNNSMTGTG
jgi:hypothetical protein